MARKSDLNCNIKLEKQNFLEYVGKKISLFEVKADFSLQKIDIVFK